jgi:hypothetical protein
MKIIIGVWFSRKNRGEITIKKKPVPFGDRQLLMKSVS